MADDDGDVVLPLEHLDTSPGDPRPHRVATVDREDIVVVAMEHRHVAAAPSVHAIHAPFHRLRTPAYHVVQAVPCSTVGVAHECIHHVGPYPVPTTTERYIIHHSRHLVTSSCS